MVASTAQSLSAQPVSSPQHIPYNFDLGVMSIMIAGGRNMANGAVTLSAEILTYCVGKTL